MPPSGDLDLVALLERIGVGLQALGPAAPVRAVLLFVAVAYPLVAAVLAVLAWYQARAWSWEAALIAAIMWIVAPWLLFAA